MRSAEAADVKELITRAQMPCVSLFLPRHRPGEAQTGDGLRLKNLMAAADRELVALGMRGPDAAALLGSARIDELHDPGSAEFHTGGMAVYVGPELSQSYRVDNGATELMTVGASFHTKPLLQSIGRPRRFFVLTLTRNQTMLFENGSGGLAPVRVPAMPGSLDDVTRYDDREPVLTTHSSSRRGTGGVVAAFHGQGKRSAQLGEDLHRYVRLIEAAITSRVGDKTLILAGSIDLVAIYRELATSGHLAPTAIFGNPASLSADELAVRAKENLAVEEERTVNAVAESFRELHGTGLASDQLTDVCVAAREGRVAALLGASNQSRWGRFDPEEAEPDQHETRRPGDIDLVDVAAQDAWVRGAEIHVVPAAAVPGNGSLAAVYRY